MSTLMFSNFSVSLFLLLCEYLLFSVSIYHSVCVCVCEITVHLYIYLQTLLSHLVENNRHDEEVKQEALRGARTVKVEKDEGEEQSEELEAGVAEG